MLTHPVAEGTGAELMHADVAPGSAGDLVRLAAQGEQEAFADLYEMVAPYVWGLALALCADRWRARRLAEATLSDVWRALPVIARGPGCPLSGVLRAARNRLLTLRTPDR